MLLQYDYGADGALGYRYDSLNRVNRKFVRQDNTESSKYFEIDYTYKSGTGTNRTTSLISELEYVIPGGSHGAAFDYTYDNIGNIESVSQGTTSTAPTLTNKYRYDEQSQLWSEEIYNNGSAYTVLYDYDTYGNILSAKKYNGVGYSSSSDFNYGTFLETDTYTYINSEWRDLLTAFNGHTITYDNIGNPLTYYNGRGYSFTWEQGRRLASAAVDGATSTYKYNKDGIRTEKTVSNSYTCEYLLDGSRVIEAKYHGPDINATLRFTYDESGNPVYFDHTEYSGVTKRYYYVLNLQGDVVQLLDENYAIVARYTYDAWGKPLAVTNGNGSAVSELHAANINPIRYRGYFYDNETGLYYCNSRYYDPEIRRFINADTTEILGASPSDPTIDKNLFAYCDNNPVMRLDNGGCLWNTIIGAVSGALVGGLTAVFTDSSVVAGIVSGAISGGISGAGLDIGAAITVASGGALSGLAIGTTVLFGAAGGGIGSYVNQRMNGVSKEEINWGDVVVDSTVGAITGAISAGTSDIGGKLCETTKQIFSKSTEKIVHQAVNDMATTTVINTGGWINSGYWKHVNNFGKSGKPLRNSQCYIIVGDR